jgi:membrane-associated phospholipid phosphatase
MNGRALALRLAPATAAAILLTAGLMAWVDRPLAQFMAGYRQTAFVGAFEVVTDLANSAIWYGAALAGIVLAWREWRQDGSPAAHALYRQRLRAAIFLIASMVVSGLVINTLKLVVGRSRPKLLINDGIADFAPFHRVLDACSFPSGHAQSIWAAMIALAWIFPRWRWSFVAVAAVVSSSRFVIGAHWASDVVAGAYFAFAVALPMRQWFERDGVSIDLTRR